MARIRTIKPEFFTSEDIFGLTPLARLFYVSLWCESDREGRLEWKLGTLKARYLPADNCDITALADELIAKELIVLYEVDGKKYAHIPTFTEHQVINNREAPSKIPARVPHASTTRESVVEAEGKGKEGKGKEGNTTTDACAPAAGGGGDHADLENPKAAPLPASQDLPELSPEAALAVALRPLNVSATSAHPTVIDWAVRGVPMQTLTEAITIAREHKGSETIPPDYLKPIVERLLNPVERRAAPRGPGGQSQKFHFEGVDRSGDVAAMEASMRRNGIDPANLDDENDKPL
ncbi:hypothetical protein [Massilia sp. ZL223]|uniref:hypothetical protein n=1 Tax=Massilia sp. ZL223 TaxID=2824904 RepID=UPI001B80ED98|nr:hypothetical protein [Massilia sp. ZL223]MBQ5963166.1 hypothetical protein [Massilia sp. ZL223]